MLQPKLTMIYRIYARPERTRRMFNCILEQDLPGIELMAIGDACKNFAETMHSEWFKDWRMKWVAKGNELFFMNARYPGRDYGAKVTNLAIPAARGHYTCFIDNDDIILAEHARFYYESIAGTDADFAYNKTIVWNNGNKYVRDPELVFGKVGHGELVVKTSFLKTMPMHERVYGQDWKLIQHMMTAGKSVKGDAPFPTYYVMSTPNALEQGID